MLLHALHPGHGITVAHIHAEPFFMMLVVIAIVSLAAAVRK